MRHKKAKIFPPGTFIPTPQRVLAIIQLCLAFSFICWYAVQPFMGEYFSLRSRSLIYEYAMGTSEMLKKKSDQLPKMDRQIKRFAALPFPDKQLILDDYQDLQKHAQRSSWIKIADGIRVLFVGIPSFELAWLFFSALISILILLKVEGAKQAAWLIPLITFAYAIDNHTSGRPVQSNPDFILFPSEEVIVKDYLKQPLYGTPNEQQIQLKKGWEQYLVTNWFPKTKSVTNVDQQIEEAEFAFTVARLKHLHGQARSTWLNNFHVKESPILLAFYVIWNLFFAWMMKPFSYTKKLPCKASYANKRK